LKASEKYLVEISFFSTSHGRVGCIVCHKGTPSPDKTVAHQELVRDPSDESTGGVCADCHAKTAKSFGKSLHYTLQGYKTLLEDRSQKGSTAEGGKLAVPFTKSCWTGCHTTCGQCHVSRPKTAKGGLYSNHKFAKDPPMDKACYGCHGIRNAGDYLGETGSPQDVHYKEKKMTCYDCHTSGNMHGVAGSPKNMYDKAAEMPRCESCHEKVLGKKSKIAAHKAHEENALACAVCHSSRYNNCYGCHLTPDGKGGFNSASERVADFKIGLNPIKTKERPYKYVVLRHIPTARDTLDPYEPGLLSNFDAIPTWKYSPVHNIRRITSQNKDCNDCHGVASLFLKESDLKPGDSEANKKVIVKEVPAEIKEEKKK
jgi:thiosulfate/3-mercaptopyruvate sulfurtransferase